MAPGGDEVQVQRGGLRVTWPVVGLLLAGILGGGGTMVNYSIQFSTAATRLSDEVHGLTRAVERLEQSTDARMRTVEATLDAHGNRLSIIDERLRWLPTATTRASPPPP